MPLRRINDDCVAELSLASKRFGALLALDELSLVVRRGELLALLGPNGAGKTTAISLLLGLARPDSGEAQLFGRSPHLIDTRRRIGVMMQDVGLAPELCVREHIELVASYYPAPLSSDEAMEMTGTSSLATRPYGKLSTGQKRQVQFATAVCGRPSLLFLDEPTVGLDVQARETLWQVVRRLVDSGVGVVLTTHYLEEVEALADRVAVLARGRLIATGTVTEMRSIVGRKQIACITAVTADQALTWPDVEAARMDHERLRITTSCAEEVVRRLLAADAGVKELEVERAGLAEAFTELTRTERMQ